MRDAAAETVDTMPGLVVDQTGRVLLMKAAERFQIMGIIVLYAERFKDQFRVAVAEHFFGLLDQFT